MTSTLVPPSSYLPASQRRKRSPNWDEFYRNGYPTDIIVIEDDTPPPTNAYLSESSAASSASSCYGSSSSSMSAISSASTRNYIDPSSTNMAPIDNSKQQLYSTSNASTVNLVPKASLMDQHYTLVSPQSRSLFDLGNSPQVNSSLKRRRDNVTSHLHLYEYDQKNVVGLEDIPMDLTTADPKKRKLEYHPPKKPVSKAKDVMVQAVVEVSFLCSRSRENPCLTICSSSRQRRKWMMTMVTT